MVVEQAIRQGFNLANRKRIKKKRKPSADARAGGNQQSTANQSLPLPGEPRNLQTTVDQDISQRLSTARNQKIIRKKNEDGSETVTIGSRVFNIPADEVEFFNSDNVPTNISPELKAAIEARSRLGRDRSQVQEIEQEQNKAALRRALLLEESERLGIPDVTLPQISELIQQDKNVRGLAPGTPQDQSFPETQIITEEILDVQKQLKEKGLGGSKSIALQKGFQIAEAGRSALKGGPPVTVKKAEEALDKQIELLNEQVEIVGQTGNPVLISQAEGDIRTAVQRLNELEASLTGLSRLNSEYFVRQGLDAQLIVKQKKRELEIIREELQEEIEEGRLRRAEERFGT